MGANSKIEWTDHTWNPWSGCSKVHEGCQFCYAEVNYSVKIRGIKWGPNGTRVRASDSMWKEPLKWNAAAEKAGVRARVFCASLADVFEDWQGFILAHGGQVILQCDNCLNPDDKFYRQSVPPFDRTKKYYEHVCGEHLRPLTMDDLRRDLFKLIDATPHLDWQLLTKRPENIRRMMEKSAVNFAETASWYRNNLWLGTSVSLQEHADKQIPELLKCRDLAPVLFVSAEPLLGPINLWSDANYRLPNGGIGSAFGWGDGINWVIVGGESGHKAREFDIGWAYSLANQCRAANTSLFMKQLGAKPYRMDYFGDPDVPGCTQHFANELGLRDKKGGDWSEWPEDLRIRQFPMVKA